MSSLRAIRKRIRSVRGTEKITRAMKMVATSKLRRARQELSAIRPFAKDLQALMARVITAAPCDGSLPDSLHHIVRPSQRFEPSKPLAAKGPPERLNDSRWSLPSMKTGGGDKLSGEETKPRSGQAEVLLFTSERGLCGGFNNNIIREAKSLIHELTQKRVRVSVSAFGKKGVEAATQERWPVRRQQGIVQPNAQQATAIAQELIKRTLAGKLDEVWLAYTEFTSPIAQTPRVKPLLPLDPQQMSESQAPDESLDPIWEPDPPRLLDALLIRYLATCLQRAALESFASEQGARMTAMESASDNAQEMIASLTLQYNRARQAAITTELMEIIGGAEALQA